MALVFQLCLQTKQEQMDEQYTQMVQLYNVPFGIICLMVLIIDFLAYMKKHHHPALQTPKRHYRTLVSPKIEGTSFLIG